MMLPGRTVATILLNRPRSLCVIEPLVISLSMNLVGLVETLTQNSTPSQAAPATDSETYHRKDGAGTADTVGAHQRRRR